MFQLRDRTLGSVKAETPQERNDLDVGFTCEKKWKSDI